MVYRHSHTGVNDHVIPQEPAGNGAGRKGKSKAAHPGKRLKHDESGVSLVSPLACLPCQQSLTEARTVCACTVFGFELVSDRCRRQTPGLAGPRRTGTPSATSRTRKLHPRPPLDVVLMYGLDPVNLSLYTCVVFAGPMGVA